MAAEKRESRVFKISRNASESQPILDCLSININIDFHNDMISSVGYLLGYLRTDISGIDQDSLFHLTHISLSFTVRHFIHANVYFIRLVYE